jgi:putative SOS response-associated peptidase YedK
MCGRIRQAGDGEQYMETLGWNPRQLFADSKQPRYNVPPGTRPLVLHRLGDGDQHADRLFWGYKPPWYKRGPASNARLDTVLKRSPFWRPLLARRIIVPAEGWYEWTGEKPDKQPWYIHAKDGAPILMAGITAWAPGRDVLAETGFAIVTDDAAGGMVDLHDRRPICLTPDDALAWVDPGTAVDEALAILSTPRPESAFEWWAVTRRMGNSRYQLSDASEPIGLSPIK